MSVSNVLTFINFNIVNYYNNSNNYFLFEYILKWNIKILLHLNSIYLK